MIEIDLAPQIQETLAAEALRRGLGLHELIRSILGTYAAGEMQSGATRAPFYPVPSSPTRLEDIPTSAASMKQVGQMMRMGAAMMGQLSCSNCTQRLTMADVEKGECSKCEGKIE
jgi:hypothetical protein